MAFNYDKYLRLEKMPTLWCWGCGDGVILKAFVRAIDKLGINRDDVCVVSGIGCSGRFSSYVDFNTVHTTHGRTVAFATGIKLVHTDKYVICVAGDGDALAIGGNHTIHGCRRNIDITMIIINNFIYDEPDQTNFGIAEYGAGSATTTTTELLSNQLSHWLSQISDEWDIGINYRPGDEISKDQVDVALSTQLLNDRVLLNGNVGYGGQAEQASNIVGDVNLEVKLNKSGKLRVKAFNKANDKLIYEESPYTQGVGIFYREEFNTFSGLMRRFWNKLTGKKEDEITPK